MFPLYTRCTLPVVRLNFFLRRNRKAICFVSDLKTFFVAKVILSFQVKQSFLKKVLRAFLSSKWLPFIMYIMHQFFFSPKGTCHLMNILMPEFATDYFFGLAVSRLCFFRKKSSQALKRVFQT